MTRSWEDIARAVDDAAALDPRERARFLDERCGTDTEFRREVEGLLRQDERASGYLEPPDLAQALRGPPPGTVFGEFTLGDPIGAGGMGRVYEAQQAKTLRRVALKLLPPLSADPVVHRRFEREAMYLGLMNHPSIAQVCAAGVDGDTPYIAMELVENGLPITEYVRRHELSTLESIELFRRVCAALAHAHAKGVVHRDLKPDNVLVDEGGTPKLIDFGIARVLEEAEGDGHSLTHANDLLGTLPYMSPELAGGSKGQVYAQTDVHALGLVLYEILCGRPARDFTGKSLTEKLRAVAEENVPLARRVRPDLPAELEWILAKALETDRARRYANVVELDRELERFVAHEPVLAGPRSTAYELRLWAKRHPTATVALTVLSVSAVVVVVLALSAMARQREVFRLGDAAKLRDLLARADRLWPADPGYVDAFSRWLDDARALTAKLGEHRETLAELRSRALPWSPAEAAADRATHPRAREFDELQKKLERARNVLRRRTRHDVPIRTDLDLAGYEGLAGDQLNRVAFDMVRRYAPRPGDPELALSLARRALDRGDCNVAEVLDTMAWAYFAAGDDETAMEYVQRACAEAPERDELAESAKDLDEDLQVAISEDGITQAEQRIAALERRVADLARIVSSRRTWKLTDDSDSWWHDRLTEIVDGLELLEDPEHGAIRGVSPEHGLGVERRLQFARDVERISLVEPAGAWRDAIAAVGADPRYAGLELTPQLGLVPLGPDPESRLQEFADIATGVVPARGADGTLGIGAESAVVFVLVPPGRFLLGAQSLDPRAPQYDDHAGSSEEPPRSMSLAAFFLAKHELTQGQWLRATGSNPSTLAPGDSLHDETFDSLHPVETVSWSQCDEFLRRQGWVFPTEAQWEYAARAGTQTPWWTGAEISTLQDAANIADADSHAKSPVGGTNYELTIHDGRLAHAPIGSYRANPFGLHDVLGNVAEWCGDLVADYGAARDPGDGRVLDAVDDRYVVRGGGFLSSDAWGVRVARRAANRPEQSAQDLGVRPARKIHP